MKKYLQNVKLKLSPIHLLTNGGKDQGKSIWNEIKNVYFHQLKIFGLIIK